MTPPMTQTMVPVRDRGSVSVAMVMLIVIVLATAGLIFDGSRYLIAERQASNIAEGAARAAVATAEPATGLSATVARVAAVDHATRLGIEPGDIAVRFPSPTSVEVTITTRRNVTFGRFAGATSITAQATGTAQLEFL